MPLMPLMGRAVALQLAALMFVAPPGHDTPAPAPEGPLPLPEAHEPKQPRRCASSPRCVRLTAVGSSFGVAGLGAVVTGSVLLSRPDEPLPDDPTTVRSTKPVGTVLVALGAGVLVSSIVMLVAAHRGRKNRSSPTTSRAPPPVAEVRF